jgi:hypothetical protein
VAVKHHIITSNHNFRTGEIEDGPKKFPASYHKAAKALDKLDHTAESDPKTARKHLASFHKHMSDTLDAYEKKRAKNGLPRPK